MAFSAPIRIREWWLRRPCKLQSLRSFYSKDDVFLKLLVIPSNIYIYIYIYINYQSKIYNLDRGRVEWVRFVTPTRRRWTSNHYITRCTGSSISWREDAGMKNMSQRGYAHRPPVEQPRRTGKKRCYGHRSGGQYVTVLFGLQLPLTHNPFNKVRGRFF